MRFFLQRDPASLYQLPRTGDGGGGLCVFDKRAILFGSEATPNLLLKFRSGERISPIVARSICLRRLPRPWTPSFWTPGCGGAADGTATAICVRCPGHQPVLRRGALRRDEGRRIYITLGQFSIVRLGRIPSSWCRCTITVCRRKECSCGSTDDPCGLFRNINFPVGEFFPNTVALPEDYEEAKNFCACCHK